jgi:hypothetical protein
MPTFSVESTANLESAAPKKGNTEANAPRRRKTPSGGSNPNGGLSTSRQPTSLLRTKCSCSVTLSARPQCRSGNPA